MIRFLIVIMMTVTAQSQTTTFPYSDFNIGFTSIVTQNTPDLPHDIHGYAMSYIHDFNTYEDSKSNGEAKYSTESLYVYSSGDKKQTISVDRNGKVTLDGVTMEDAFLLLYANTLEERMNRQFAYDKQEKDHEEAKKDVTPHKMIYQGNPWDIDELPDWSKGKVLGDTRCSLKKIRILEDRTDKRGTMLHELMHVASGCKDNFEIHSLISQMGPGLLKILQDNPDIVDYLTKRPKIKPGITVWPKIASVQLMMDPVQAKYPGNEWAKPCGPMNHAVACVDLTMRHIVNHIYGDKENCETNEGVKCTDMYQANQKVWMPIGKPVFYDETEVSNEK